MILDKFQVNVLQKKKKQNKLDLENVKFQVQINSALISFV